MKKILFILKKNHGYENSNTKSSGLFYSAKFVVDMLNKADVETKLVEVTDNNDIDREVTAYKPHIVIIEALWVVPEKFDVLKKLHPHVKWVVRIHSDLPFLATEGVAISWIKGYLRRNIFVAFNAWKTFLEFRKFPDRVIYLPNYYPQHKQWGWHLGDLLHIGCFGALRPLKNQLLQARAAIKYADSIGKSLVFYVNATRCEQGGGSVLKNLRALFAKPHRHCLVELSWMDHHKFVEVVRQMDAIMQVSFTETFCITAADAVSVGVPLVCSPDIEWATWFSKASPNSVRSIAKGLARVLGPFKDTIKALNTYNLREYSKESRRVWLRFASIEFRR